MLNKKFTNIDSYIEIFPLNVQEKLELMRKTIHEVAPEAIEVISYQMPTFKLNGKNLVHFAGYAHHIGFYPVPTAITAFKRDLVSYVTSKGAVQFPLDRPIPVELVKKIVKFRVRENLGKK